MLLGAIADDFTGGSDLANTLAKGGMATMQFVGVGRSPAPAHCEAGVVALKTRSIEPDEAVRQSIEAARWLLEQGCEQILFKYCSTFDSTSKGNIGPVAEALLDLLDAPFAVVCPAFPATGRRVFMGHLFVGDRLLNESGMENHPLTPMADADLRRWLRLQTKDNVGHVALDIVRQGNSGILHDALVCEHSKGARLIVADAIEDADLLRLGAGIATHRLITGGSGIAMGLPENFRSAERLAGASSVGQAVAGPAVVLCGSCSLASQAQVAHYIRTRPGLPLEPGEIVNGKMSVDRSVRWYWQHSADTPIIYSTGNAVGVAEAQARYGQGEIARSIETFFADFAKRLADEGVRCIVVGGGETSGAVVEALGISTLQIGPEIDPGVPALFADRNGPIGLALKSGNFGGEDFFAKAVQKVRGHD